MFDPVIIFYTAMSVRYCHAYPCLCDFLTAWVSSCGCDTVISIWYPHLCVISSYQCDTVMSM